MKNIAAAAIAAVMLLGSAGNATARKQNNVAKVIELTENDFNKKVYDITSDKMMYLGELPAVVDFTAVWCGPCQRTAPILEQIAAEYAGKVVVYKIDVDKCRMVAQAMNISSIPAILYIPMGDNKPVMTVGARGKDAFKKEIAEYLLK